MKINRAILANKRLLFRLITYFILLILITLFISSYFTYKHFSNSFKDEINNYNHRVLNQLSIFSDEFLLQTVTEVGINLIMNQADLPGTDIFMNSFAGSSKYELVNCHNELSRIVFKNRNIIDSIFIHSRENNILVSSEFIKYNVAEDFEHFNQIKRFYNSGQSIRWYQPCTADVYSDSMENKGDIITVLLSYPLSVTGSDIQGCIGININESTLSAYLKSFNSMNFGQLMIIDQTGGIISHTDKASLYRNISTEPFIKKILASNKSYDFMDKFDKTEQVISFMRSKYNNWYYVSIIPSELFYEKDYNIKKRILLVSIYIFIIVFVLSNIFSFNIYRPFKRILDKHLTAANYDSRGKSINEFKLLDVMFSDMSDKIRNLQDTLNRNSPMIMNNFLNELLNNHINNKDKLDNFLRLSEIKFSKPYFCVATFIISKSVVDSGSQGGIQLYKYSIIDFIKSIKSDSSRYHPVDTGSTAITVIINSDTNRIDNVKEFVNEVGEFCLNNFKFCLFAGMGGFFNDPFSIHCSYIDALRCLQLKFIRPDCNIFYYEDNIRLFSNEASTELDFAAEIEKCLNLENHIEITNIISRFVSAIANSDISYINARKETSRFMNVYKNYLLRMNMNFEEIADESLRKKFLYPDNIKEFGDTFLCVIQKAFIYLTNKRDNKNIELVDKVKRYVIDHLNIDISLNSVAEALHISPNYLSKIFKDETGINYIEFVVNYKIEKAKELLMSTNLSIEVITNCIGYSHVTYFTRKFKEVTGKTPNEYRNGYRV